MLTVDNAVEKVLNTNYLGAYLIATENKGLKFEVILPSVPANPPPYPKELHSELSTLFNSLLDNGDTPIFITKEIKEDSSYILHLSCSKFLTKIGEISFNPTQQQFLIKIKDRYGSLVLMNSEVLSLTNQERFNGSIGDVSQIVSSVFDEYADAFESMLVYRQDMCIPEIKECLYKIECLTNHIEGYEDKVITHLLGEINKVIASFYTPSDYGRNRGYSLVQDTFEASCVVFYLLCGRNKADLINRIKFRSNLTNKRATEVIYDLILNLNEFLTADNINIEYLKPAIRIDSSNLDKYSTHLNEYDKLIIQDLQKDLIELSFERTSDLLLSSTSLVEVLRIVRHLESVISDAKGDGVEPLNLYETYLTPLNRDSVHSLVQHLVDLASHSKIKIGLIKI